MEQTANLPSLTQRTILSPEQRKENAKMVLASPAIKSSEAYKMAKRLTGQFPHLKPGEPEFFLMGVAAILEQYPAGLVAESLRPDVGYAVTVEYFSLKSLREWFQTRLEMNMALANWRPRQLPPPEQDFSPEHRLTMLMRLKELFSGADNPNMRKA